MCKGIFTSTFHVFTIDYKFEEKFDRVSRTMNIFVETLNFTRLIFVKKIDNEISRESRDSREIQFRESGIPGKIFSREFRNTSLK